MRLLIVVLLALLAAILIPLIAHSEGPSWIGDTRWGESRHARDRGAAHGSERLRARPQRTEPLTRIRIIQQEIKAMSGATKIDPARLLTLPEQELAGLTQHPAIAGLSRQELQALARHLREARYRARDIARQQRREMRGKAEPRGTTPALDNVGAVDKGRVLKEALERVIQELRHIRSAGLAFPTGATRQLGDATGSPLPCNHCEVRKLSIEDSNIPQEHGG